MPTYNRRLFASQALYVGNVTGGPATQLSRIQSISDGFELSRQKISQYGKLAPLSHEIVDSPAVNLSFSYLATNGANETALGFDTGGVNGTLANFLDDTQDQKNYYIITVPEGQDAVDGTIVDTRGIGNGFISSYSVEGSVGGFLNASVAVEALNMKYDIGSGGTIPAIQTNGSLASGSYTIPAATTGSANQPIVIKQGDITLDFTGTNNIGAVLTGASGIHIQSFNLTVPISREALNRIGSRFAYTREITFPVDATLSVSAFLNGINSGSISSLFCNDYSYDIGITCRTQTCDGSTGSNILKYVVKGAKVNSQSYGGSIGPAQSVDLGFVSSIGSSSDNTKNVFITAS